MNKLFIATIFASEIDFEQFLIILKEQFPNSPFLIIFIFALVYFFPDQSSIFAGKVFKFLSYINKNFKKHSVKRELEGRIGMYVSKLAKKFPELEIKKVTFKWVNSNTDREAFLNDGTAIILLKDDDPSDLNFVHAVYLFVSTSLLYKAKKYLSKTQRNSIDLFVSSQLIQSEKPNVAGIFLDEYLFPSSEGNNNIKSLLSDFETIDNNGIFYPIFIHELSFLGSKYFGSVKDDIIIKEVKGLINFLKNFALRERGDKNTPTEFKQVYCRCEIVIVGLGWKVTSSVSPYTNYIKGSNESSHVDSLYLVAPIENTEYVEQICSEIGSLFTLINSFKITQKIVGNNGDFIEQEGHISILQSKNNKIIRNYAHK